MKADAVYLVIGTILVAACNVYDVNDTASNGSGEDAVVDEPPPVADVVQQVQNGTCPDGTLREQAGPGGLPCNCHCLYAPGTTSCNEHYDVWSGVGARSSANMALMNVVMSTVGAVACPLTRQDKVAIGNVCNDRLTNGNKISCVLDELLRAMARTEITPFNTHCLPNLITSVTEDIWVCRHYADCLDDIFRAGYVALNAPYSSTKVSAMARQGGHVWNVLTMNGLQYMVDSYQNVVYVCLDDDFETIAR